MKVLLITGREIGYARNEVLLRALQRFAQVDVVAASTQPRSLIWNSFAIAFQALPKVLRGGYDLIVVGFYGHIIQALISRLTSTPILFDAFVSSYDTLCFDRQLFAPNSLVGRAAFWLDRTTTQAATHVLLDTPRHAAYFVETFGLPAEKVSALPVGCQESIFQPQPFRPTHQSFTQVLYYSTYLPLHGVETVIRAAHHLRHEAICFRLIGNGPEYAAVRQLAEKFKLENITFAPPVSLAEIATEIAAADICLGGHFGDSDKAGRVVPGKIYQILAMARPAIAAASPANGELLTHGQNAWLIPSGDPLALAQAIQTLHDDCALRHHLGQQGRQLYEQTCSEAVITEQLHKIITSMT
ncbi:MAG: glycosyltransferase [Caldilineaceae bacterium]